MTEIRNFLTIDERDFTENFQIVKIKTLLNESFANKTISINLDDTVQNNSWFEILNESSGTVNIVANIPILSADYFTTTRASNELAIPTKTVLKLFYRIGESPVLFSVKNLTT